ncbi:MAG TPA: LuxR C-terminal-related transcriptional regulator [Pyrinomonadaceae bacterium]|nr:LuxR C-terminal-related transcriptional regulator [Pyrinomonadaceae bacterium]
MALLALSHTPLEDLIYRAMLSEVTREESTTGAFSVKHLATLTGISSSSTVRRMLAGLLRKLSIQKAVGVHSGRESEGFVYQIFRPEEIFERRRAAGLPPYPKEIETCEKTASFNQAIERIAANGNLSRREAQVALACVEGLTNAEIGLRLRIGEQTVKFHLRNIFTKFGVRRRTELISRLLAQDRRAPSGAGEELAGRTI